MELTNEFTVAAPIDEAWKLLTDLERIAPCMPGAELHEVDGAVYRGVMKVKVGPINARYEGRATFVERDEASRVAVLRAEGRDSRGQGTANATITASLSPTDDGTQVTVLTDFLVTGRVAQFGRGVLADVSTRLMRQFVESLEANMLGADAGDNGTTGNSAGDRAASGEEAGLAAGTSQLGPRRIEYVPAEPINLMETAGGAIGKRLLPVAFAFGFIGAWWVGRYRRLRRLR